MPRLLKLYILKCVCECSPGGSRVVRAVCDVTGPRPPEAVGGQLFHAGQAVGRQFAHLRAAGRAGDVQLCGGQRLLLHQ